MTKPEQLVILKGKLSFLFSKMYCFKWKYVINSVYEVTLKVCKLNKGVPCSLNHVWRWVGGRGAYGLSLKDHIDFHGNHIYADLVFKLQCLVCLFVCPLPVTFEQSGMENSGQRGNSFNCWPQSFFFFSRLMHIVAPIS